MSKRLIVLLVALAAFGLFVLGQAAWKVAHPVTPDHQIMGVLGVLALVANATCLYLLWRHRAEDVNMRSVWLCSRNDIVANLGVLVSAVLVWRLGNQWPDLVMGLVIAFGGLFGFKQWQAWQRYRAYAEQPESRRRRTAVGRGAPNSYQAACSIF